MTTTNNAEAPLEACVACGRVARFSDQPCSCGNNTYFVRLKDCALIFFQGIPLEKESSWESEVLALSA